MSPALVASEEAGIDGGITELSGPALLGMGDISLKPPKFFAPLPCLVG